HTRFSRDWSSDVCSSDLLRRPRAEQRDAVIDLQCLEFRLQHLALWSVADDLAAEIHAAALEFRAGGEQGRETLDLVQPADGKNAIPRGLATGDQARAFRHAAVDDLDARPLRLAVTPPQVLAVETRDGRNKRGGRELFFHELVFDIDIVRVRGETERAAQVVG